MSKKSDKKDLIEIWQDIVEIKSLIVAIIISTIFTMSAYFLAPKDSIPLQLFFGLSGAVIAFIINAVLIKPKRNIIYKEDEDGH